MTGTGVDLKKPEDSMAPKNEASFNFKKLFSDLAVYGSGNLLIKGMSLISAPIFTRIFDPSQYGAWSLINVSVAFFTGILLLGGDNAYTRFFFQCKTEEDKQTLSATWFMFLAAWSLVLLAVILPFSRVMAGWLLDSNIYHQAFLIGLLSGPPAMMNLILSQALRNRFKAKTYTALNVATAALTLVLAVIFVLVFNLGVTGALLGALVSALVMMPVRLIFIRDLLKWRFSLRFLRQLLLFGLPLVPMNVAFWLLSNADRIMLARLSDLDNVGLYSIAAAMTAVLMLLQNAIGQSWLPHAVKVYEENKAYAAEVFKKTMLYLLTASGFIIVGFVALAQETLYILVPPGYYDSFKAIPYLSIGFLFFTTAQVSAVGIMVKNKTVYIMLACWTVALINIGLNALFIPRWGIAGAGAATGLSYILFAVSYFCISRRLWRVDYNWMASAGLLFFPLCAIMAITVVAASELGVFAALAIKMAILLLCCLILLAILGKTEKIGLKSLVNRGISSLKKN